MRIYSNTFKREYPNTVFLEKHGIFYYAYGENALVLSGICNYQFKDNRCGFPIKSLEKVLSILSEFKVNVYVDNMFFEFGDKYSFYLELYKSKINGDKLINNLINDIKKVIESNRENYYKLKEFVDSL